MCWSSRVLLFQEANLLFEDLLEPASQTVRYQLGAIEAKKRDMKGARRRQSAEIAGVFVFSQMDQYIVDAWMQYTTTAFQVAAFRPEVALVLVAPHTRINQVVRFVIAACCGRLIMV